MNAASERAWVVVLGATGYMGRLVCRALRRRNIAFSIAGRDARKLALLSDSLGGVESHVVDARSPDSLRKVLERRLLVCACAGPFLEIGETALAVAAELGVHYVDVCEEQAFLRQSIERYDAVARAGGACVVPAMTFESSLGDWAASLLAERLGGKLDTLDLVYAVRGPEVGLASSRGSLRSAVAALAQGEGGQHVGGALRAERDAAVVRRFETKSFGEITAASFAAGGAVLVPAHLDVTQVRTFRAVTPVTARVLQIAGGLGPLLARAGRATLERLLGYAAEGPDIVTRAETRFEVIALARRGDAQARVHLTGTDPHAVTAEIQAQAAEGALAGVRRSVRRGRAQRRVPGARRVRVPRRGAPHGDRRRSDRAAADGALGAAHARTRAA